MRWIVIFLNYINNHTTEAETAAVGSGEGVFKWVYSRDVRVEGKQMDRERGGERALLELSHC